MRIKEIRYYPLYPKDDYGGAIERGENFNTLIELEDENGVKGYGSTYTTLAITAAAMRLIGPALKSEGPLTSPARISERLHQQHFWLGRGGSITHVISGVDIALWDLFGKRLGVSVSVLAGGRYRDKIRPYASLSFSDDRGSLENKIRAALDRGFTGIKLGWGTFGRKDLKNDERLVAECRRIMGDDIALMIDAGGSGTFYAVTYKRALETAKMLREYNVEWYEEALRADDIEGYIKLREHSPVKISACEVLTRRQSFFPWIERGAVDIVQPDCTKAGGLTEQLRIAWHAYDHGIDCIGHGWNTAFGLAADLQVSAAMPVSQWVEYITPSPLMDNITQSPFVIKDGFLDIPDKPGLGIEPDMEKVQYYSTPGE
ncbi:MAG: mandelate racemase/muconate lactonizing enzyme family protein [Oscillospiraceae bacterium]|nr:mandelate racemase/muconate lactonizing enzyme family protein [Oscillospiraceae bacterium]